MNRQPITIIDNLDKLIGHRIDDIVVTRISDQEIRLTLLMETGSILSIAARGGDDVFVFASLYHEVKDETTTTPG